jgi:hypothetical protein
VALGDRPPCVKHLKLLTCPIPVHFTQEWILPPLGRSTAPWCQILLIKRLAYQCLDYRLSTEVQLITENTLTVVLPLLLRKDLSTLLRMLRLWEVVLGGNILVRSMPWKNLTV